MTAEEGEVTDAANVGDFDFTTALLTGSHRSQWWAVKEGSGVIKTRMTTLA